MNNLYYITYCFTTEDTRCYNSPIYGELYAVDTGFGVLELGCIEDNTIYEDIHLRYGDKNIKEYINNFTGTVLSFTKVA